MKEHKWFWYTKETKQENKSPRQAVSCHLHFKFTFQNQWLTQLELPELLFSVIYKVTRLIKDLQLQVNVDSELCWFRTKCE